MGPTVLHPADTPQMAVAELFAYDYICISVRTDLNLFRRDVFDEGKAREVLLSEGYDERDFHLIESWADVRNLVRHRDFIDVVNVYGFREGLYMRDLNEILPSWLRWVQRDMQGSTHRLEVLTNTVVSSFHRHISFW